jgi:APA family basic amino acid/polyamine antiporter
VPERLGRISERTRTPIFVTALFGGLIAILAALVPLTEIAKLVNIGTLFAFLLVNIGVIVLRRTKPDLERGFRVPFVPVFPIIGSLLCIYLMSKLEAATWWRFGIWLVAGLVIYGLYGFRHSRLRNPQEPEPAGS